jgi:hypothetical protein
MADKLITVNVNDYEADGASTIGSVVNVYDTYANALAHTATGLSTINVMTVLTGAAGAAISQVAKTTGVTVDNNGQVKFYADDNGSSQEYFLMSVNGRSGGPQKVIAQ